MLYRIDISLISRNDAKLPALSVRKLLDRYDTGHRRHAVSQFFKIHTHTPYKPVYTQKTAEAV